MFYLVSYNSYSKSPLEGTSKLYFVDNIGIIAAGSQGGDALAANANRRSDGDISEITVQAVKAGDNTR
jgi:hypothetical protein